MSSPRLVRPLVSASLAALALSLAPACGDDAASGDPDLSAPPGDGGSSVACIANLAAIALTPADSQVTLDGKTAAPIAFTATGTFTDGKTAALDPAKLAWKVSRADDTPPGTISAGTLAPYPKSGGTVTVTATDSCKSGSTTVRFSLAVTLGTPSDPNAWNATPVATNAPPIVYPSDKTMFPRNIYRTLFQWRTQGFTEFRLTFTGPASKVTVYSDGVHALCMKKTPAAGCWEADETAWSYISGSNAGQTVAFTVDALDKTQSPAVVRRGAAVNIGFSRRDVSGAIFYWSTTSAGVRRANIADAQPENYVAAGTVYSTPTTDQVKCVACHVVSRDGKYMAAPVSAQSGNSLWIMDVTLKAPPTPQVKSVADTGGHGFATISPDDAQVVAAWGGKMWSLERATGKKIADLNLAGLKGTHPDWSPDNTQLVFATGSGDSPGGASLAVLPWQNNTWGAPQTLVPAAGLSNLFPMFAPDGKWIAYSRGKGGHGDLTAQLWIVGAKGGAPVELVAANRVVSNVTGNGQTENSQPTWAPPGDLNWIAFNSKRAYGVVSPAGTQQIWVAAVDLSKAQPGQDPSYPAFHLQFQGLTENNHRAFWTLDVRDPTPVPDGGVPPDMTTGDMARMCIANGGTCVPGLDRCCNDPDYACDSDDNGATYKCLPQLIP